MIEIQHAVAVDHEHRGYDLVPSLWETLSQHIRECGDNDFLPTGSWTRSLRVIIRWGHGIWAFAMSSVIMKPHLAPVYENRAEQVAAQIHRIWSKYCCSWLCFPKTRTLGLFSQRADMLVRFKTARRCDHEYSCLRLYSPLSWSGKLPKDGTSRQWQAAAGSDLVCTITTQENWMDEHKTNISQVQGLFCETWLKKLHGHIINSER